MTCAARWALATSRKAPAPGQREAVFHPEFRDDLRFWVETERCTALRLLALVEAILRDPFQGVGKPEPLKYLGASVWSRPPCWTSACGRTTAAGRG